MREGLLEYPSVYPRLFCTNRLAFWLMATAGDIRMMDDCLALFASCNGNDMDMRGCFSDRWVVPFIALDFSAFFQMIVQMVVCQLVLCKLNIKTAILCRKIKEPNKK